MFRAGSSPLPSGFLSFRNPSLLDLLKGKGYTFSILSQNLEKLSISAKENVLQDTFR
jgi:hypothetical protein